MCCQRYLSSAVCDYAAELLSTFPPSLDRVYFVNSGSEANDLSLRLAMAASPGRRDILCLDAAYHGSTVSTVECSPYKFRYQAGLAAASHIHVCALPNAYAGVGTEEAVQDVRRHIDSIHSAGGSVLAFIHESSPSCAGQLLLPRDYLLSVYAAVRSAGGVCIADEVQSGLARNGCTWWEFERLGVLPDIVTAGKALGGGVYPIAAVITSSAIAERFTATGYEYFNTAAGTNAAAAVGLALIAVVRSEERMQHARRVGQYWLSGLSRLQSAHPLIGDVRGIGLFLGVEISQPGSALPATEEAAWLVNWMRAVEDVDDAQGDTQHERVAQSRVSEQQPYVEQRQSAVVSSSLSSSSHRSSVVSGVLLSTDGPHQNVIKIKPPMCIEESDIDCMLRVFEKALIECERWRICRSQAAIVLSAATSPDVR